MEGPAPAQPSSAAALPRDAAALVEEERHYEAWQEGVLRALAGEGGHQALTPRGDAGVGLLNLGATCYMNTLLQVLFHTPELRTALYAWRHDPVEHGDTDHCLPFQLQRLFAQLQLSRASAVSTRPLAQAIATLGMQIGVEQDVQELCRLFFEALERSSSELRATLKQLYAGSMVHYIQSLEPLDGSDTCPETRREEHFLDLQVPIQGCASLGDALLHCVEPELLDEGNQWFCEDLGRKVDALKGIRFESLPPLLCLQLLRFVFDPMTMQRQKLNEVLSIPLELDFAAQLGLGAGQAAYELVAVCLHSGTVEGGHYRAYIRDAASGSPNGEGACWLDANDTDVATISPERSEALFSGKGEEHVEGGAGLEEFVGIMYQGNDVKDLPCGSLDEARMIAAREVTGPDISAGYVMVFGRIWIKHSARDNHPSVRKPVKAPGNFMFYVKLENPDVRIQEFTGLFYWGGQTILQLPCASLDDAREIAQKEVTSLDKCATYSQQMSMIFVKTGAREMHPYRTPPETGDGTFTFYLPPGSKVDEAEAQETTRALKSSDAYFVVYRRAGSQIPAVLNSDIPDLLKSELLTENERLQDLQRAYRFHQQAIDIRVFAPPEAQLLLRRRGALQLDSFLGGANDAGAELQGRWDVRFSAGHHFELVVAEGGQVTVPGSQEKGLLMRTTGAEAADGWTYRAAGHHGMHKWDLLKVVDGQLVIRHWAVFLWLDALGTRLWAPGEVQSVVVSSLRQSTVSHLLERALHAFANLAENDDAWAWAKDLKQVHVNHKELPASRLRRFDWIQGEAGAPLDGEAEVGAVLAKRPSGRENLYLLLELSESGGSFDPWTDNCASITVCRWDSEVGVPSLSPGDLVTLRLPPQDPVGGPPTVGAVRAAAAAALGCADEGGVALVPLAGTRAGQALLNDEQTLSESGVDTGCALCAEAAPAGSSALGSTALYVSARAQEAEACESVETPPS